MSEKQARKLQQIYANSCSAPTLCQTIAHDLNADFVLVAWYIKEQIWHISCIYANGQLHNQGWYLNEKPSATNSPIEYKHKLNNIRSYQSNNKIILFSGNNSKIHASYAFTLKAYLDVLYMLDINQRQLYRKELLLSNICHSIRTPLNGILHMTSMLMNEDKNSEKLNHEHLQYLNQSALSLANNIFDIIDVTQLDIGKLRINKSVCSIREIVSNVINVARSLNKAPNVKIDYYIDPVVPQFAYTDPKRLKQILINLFDNALKHTQKGEVTLFATASLVFLDQENSSNNGTTLNANSDQCDQYQVIFAIQDSGLGMTEEQQQIIFKPPEIIQNAKQYGISLRVSYLLAQKLGGSLYLKYSGVNRGSCFELSLVVYDEEPPRYNSKTLKLLANKKVLLIDNSNDKITLCQVMDQFDMKYAIASSYEELLILHMKKTYDLVICKITLDRENGADICAKLRVNWPNVKYIALAEDANAVPKNVFDDVLSLPVEQFSFKTKLISIFNEAEKLPCDQEKIYILAVDDERINRIVTEKLLRSRGYSHIDLAGSGEEALSMIKARPSYYNVVITDIRMPNMDGFELAREIDLLGLDNKPAIIGLTAQMILDDEPTDLFKDFLHKPVDLDELDKTLQKTLSIVDH